jgi:hypothetical protein
MMGQARELLRSAVEAGVRFVIGPDAGIAPHRPHYVLPYTVAGTAQIMGDAEALSAATYHAAAACNLGDRKGRLAPGLDADILAVEGIPSLTSPQSTAGSRCSIAACPWPPDQPNPLNDLVHLQNDAHPRPATPSERRGHVMPSRASTPGITGA